MWCLFKIIKKGNHDNIPEGTFSAGPEDQERLKRNTQKSEKVGRPTNRQLDRMWDVELVSTACYHPPSNTTILISRPSPSNQNVNRHVGVAETEDTSLSLGRLWIILYHIVRAQKRDFLYTHIALLRL